MSIHIKKARPATDGEWDFIWKECSYSTYFHSREWAEIWNIYTKGKMHPEPKLISFSDGKEALLPLSFEKSINGSTRDYISSPAGTFGGWITAHELDIEHAILLTDYLTKKCRNLIWRLNPYDQVVFKAGITTSRDDETYTLNLSEGFDAIYKRWANSNNSVARKVRKAHKAGVSARIASSIDDWHLYYKVYEDSMRRWGDKVSSKYSWELFEEMFRRNSPSIRLWLAVYQDIVVAGALCLNAKKNVVYWHGSALEEYFNVRPVNLLFYEIIKVACEEGYSWFDFNPSGGHKGVEDFKRSFGTERMSSPIVYRERKTVPIIEIVSKIVRKFRS